jgi:undecaprenyl-diphosphatase
LLVAQRKRLLLFWLFAAIGAVVLTDILKWAFARPRPTTDAIYLPHGGYSFPSGHTMGAVVIYFMLAYVLYRLNNNPQVGRLFATIAAACTLLVSVSLLLIGVHYLTDILAALALGAAWLGIVITWAEATPTTVRAPRKTKRRRTTTSSKTRPQR